jgi:hypothetical protein
MPIILEKTWKTPQTGLYCLLALVSENKYDLHAEKKTRIQNTTLQD